MVRRFLYRHQSRNDVISLLKSGFGAALAMGVIGFFGQLSDLPFLIAPFGASCVLLFSAPSSPLSQPMNVIGGHMVASALALALRAVLPPEWWAISLVVGLAIAVMALLRITHPPAGADPVVVFLADPGWSFLFVPILAGCMVMIGIATLVHMIPKRTIYPLVLQDVLQENSGDPKKPKR